MFLKILLIIIILMGLFIWSGPYSTFLKPYHQIFFRELFILQGDFTAAMGLSDDAFRIYSKVLSNYPVDPATKLRIGKKIARVIPDYERLREYQQKRFILK